MEGGFCQGIESDRCAWDEHRGFGFIKPDDGGADIFVHAKSIIGASVLQPRQQVEFESVFDSVRGKYGASDVRGDLANSAGLRPARQDGLARLRRM